jgi:hypothetical protein
VVSDEAIVRVGCTGYYWYYDDLSTRWRLSQLVHSLPLLAAVSHEPKQMKVANHLPPVL